MNSPQSSALVCWGTPPTKMRRQCYGTLGYFSSAFSPKTGLVHTVIPPFIRTFCREPYVAERPRLTFSSMTNVGALRPAALGCLQLTWVISRKIISHEEEKHSHGAARTRARQTARAAGKIGRGRGRTHARGRSAQDVNFFSTPSSPSRGS